MLLLVSRGARPDVRYWRGRRTLAVLDALAWPAIVLVAIRTARFSTGIFGLVVSTLAVLIAARRLHRAIFLNQRYHFTTSRWGMVLAALIAIGIGARLMLV